MRGFKRASVATAAVVAVVVTLFGAGLSGGVAAAESPASCGCINCAGSGENCCCGDAREARKAVSVLLGSQEFHALREQMRQQGNFRFDVGQVSVASSCCSESGCLYRVVLQPADSIGHQTVVVVAVVDLARRELLELHNNVIPLEEVECWLQDCWLEEAGPGCWCWICSWWCCFCTKSVGSI